MYARKYLGLLKERFNEKRKFIQIILGPRQVGKTTLAGQLCDSLNIPHIFISADSIPTSNLLWIDQQWEVARLKLGSSESNELLLVIDEIQKIINWAEAIKKNWDFDTRNKINIKVLLLGSSSLLIQQGLTESLTGRFEVIQFRHWSYNEMKEAFNLSPEQYVYFGSYPGSIDLIGDEKRWREYIKYAIIETTISKDILQLTNIQKPALLKNLFELGCRYSCEILSYTKIIGQLQDAGNTTTLTHYQDLLDKSWMLKGLQKYSGSQSSVRSSIPKWIIYNSALSTIQSPNNFKDEMLDPVIFGRRVEQAIGSHLLNQSREIGFEVYYWREGNNEVDFVIVKQGVVVTIEVKTGKVKFHKGIEKFNEKYNVHKNILISKEGLTWQEFLDMDIELLFS